MASTSAIRSASNSEREARIDLAAAHRIAVLENLHEACGNHFSLIHPDGSGRILVTPGDRHWSQVTASSLAIAEPSDDKPSFGNVAYSIHGPIHAERPETAACVLHVHSPYATALACIDGGRLEMADQNAGAFYDKVAYFDAFDGIVTSENQGERLAEALGDSTVLFLKNHGVIVVGSTVPEAITDLYYLERACMIQFLVKSTGQQIAPISADVGRMLAKWGGGPTGYKLQNYLAWKRLLDSTQPDYAT